jgi:hypothetical protein
VRRSDPAPPLPSSPVGRRAGRYPERASRKLQLVESSVVRPSASSLQVCNDGLDGGLEVRLAIEIYLPVLRQHPFVFWPIPASVDTVPVGVGCEACLFRRRQQAAKLHTRGVEQHCVPQITAIFVLNAALCSKSIPHHTRKGVRGFVEKKLESAEPLQRRRAAGERRVWRNSRIGVANFRHIEANVHPNWRRRPLLLQILGHGGEFQAEVTQTWALRCDPVLVGVIVSRPPGFAIDDRRGSQNCNDV